MEPACRDAAENPSEANLVRLLDLWSAEWKRRGRTRAVGPGAYERYATLRLFGQGGVVGVSNATGLREACAAVNSFLRSRFPSGSWTSIAVLFNPRMGLHRDIQNMPGHSNHALALGDYTGGRVWIEDDEGDSTAWLADKKGGRELRGRWLDMHDKPVSFDARRYTWLSHTRAACGRSRLMFRKPMLGRRSSTGRRSGRRVFRCRRSAFERRRDTQFQKCLRKWHTFRTTSHENHRLREGGPWPGGTPCHSVILSFCHCPPFSDFWAHLQGFLEAKPLRRSARSLTQAQSLEKRNK